MLSKSSLRRGLSRVAEPHVLFPLVAALLLVITWGTTIGIIGVRHAATRHTTAVSSRELLDTYEAQVVRALREMDQALNLVKYWPQRAAGHFTLADPMEKGLLPTDLLFVVSIADAQGNIVESTRPIDKQNVVDQDYFSQQRASDSFFIARLPQGLTGDMQLSLPQAQRRGGGVRWRGHRRGSFLTPTSRKRRYGVSGKSLLVLNTVAACTEPRRLLRRLIYVSHAAIA